MAGTHARPDPGSASLRMPSAAVATAAILFTATMIALATGWVHAAPAIEPPTWFWLSLVDVLGSTLLIYAGLRSRAPARPPHRATAAAAARPAPPSPYHAPAIRAPAPTPPPQTEDIDVFLANLDTGDVPPVVLPPAATAEPNLERQPSDIAMLTEWLDGICDQVSEWAAIATSLDEPSKTVEPEAYTETWNPVLVPALDGAKAAEAKGGAWTESRARTAVQRYLHLKPWAPASHVAEALDMDLRLATRVVESLRREGAV